MTAVQHLLPAGNACQASAPARRTVHIKPPHEGFLSSAMCKVHLVSAFNAVFMPLLLFLYPCPRLAYLPARLSVCQPSGLRPEGEAHGWRRKLPGGALLLLLLVVVMVLVLVLVLVLLLLLLLLLLFLLLLLLLIPLLPPPLLPLGPTQCHGVLKPPDS